jgi:hypothetical protein
MDVSTASTVPSPNVLAKVTAPSGDSIQRGQPFFTSRTTRRVPANFGVPSRHGTNRSSLSSRMIRTSTTGSVNRASETHSPTRESSSIAAVDRKGTTSQLGSTKTSPCSRISSLNELISLASPSTRRISFGPHENVPEIEAPLKYHCSILSLGA